MTGKVTRRGTSTVVASMPLSLQRRMWGSTTWTSLNTGTTGGNGAKARPVKHYSKATYRVVAKGVVVSRSARTAPPSPPRGVATTPDL